ncbi:MAG TPA: hypothetical protein VK791_11855 [bacterium]|jgi:hypothetical protein|nr:hypothetical protein [bacterium]
MKKTLAFLLMLSLAVISSASAQSSPDYYNRWFIQVNGDLGLPTGHLANAVNTGWGGEGSIGVQVDRNLDMSVESGYDTYAAKNTTFNATWNMIPLILKAQVYGGGGRTRPYLFAGAGAAFNSQNASFGNLTASNSEVDFLGELGAGLSIGLSEQSSFFAQVKVEMDNTSSNYSNDTPTVLVPINAGFKFALN